MFSPNPHVVFLLPVGIFMGEIFLSEGMASINSASQEKIGR